MSRLCLVTGATGTLGPSVIQALTDCGDRVRGLALPGPRQPALPPGVELIEGSVLSEDTLEKAARDVDVVVHLAAKLHVQDPIPAELHEYHRVNVEGTRVVLHAAQRARAKRVVLFSTICVYGSGGVFDEESEVRPVGAYATSKLEAERLVLAARTSDGHSPQGVVLRLGAVFGPRMKGNYVRLAQALRGGWFVRVGDGRNRRTLIFDGDVARAAVLATLHPHAPGRVFNVTDGRIHTLDGIITAICSALGRRPPRLSVPARPARVVAGVLQDLHSVVGRRSPVSRATIDKLTEDVAVSGQRFIHDLGFRPSVEFEEGWRRTVGELP